MVNLVACYIHVGKSRPISWHDAHHRRTYVAINYRLSDRYFGPPAREYRYTLRFEVL